jgi:pullulanase/glycogen debranching enzyme
MGVNFALFSKHAERAELCLFDPRGRREVERVDLRDQTDLVWSGTATSPRAGPGCFTANGRTDRTTPKRATDSTPTSCYSTPKLKFLAVRGRCGDVTICNH